jgi:Tat protein secretion system quality control protein TatD with DNase activity
MAALLAKIMHKRTKNNLSQLNENVLRLIAKLKPINAKGRAKIVWLNFMRDK